MKNQKRIVDRDKEVSEKSDRQINQLFLIVLTFIFVTTIIPIIFLV